MPEFEFDGSSMDDLSRDLREAAALMRTETDKTLFAVGEIVAVAAKKVASDAGSSSIPPTIKAHHDVPHIARVTAGSADVPLAALWDLGNKKGGRRSKTFNHPVYAHGPRNKWTWVPQPRHPILSRARTLTRKSVTDLMSGAWDKALKPYTRGK